MNHTVRHYSFHCVRNPELSFRWRAICLLFTSQTEKEWLRWSLEIDSLQNREPDHEKIVTNLSVHFRVCPKMVFVQFAKLSRERTTLFSIISLTVGNAC
jgi:hypothetical protein